MYKLTAYFSLFRFELPFSAGVCVVLGQVLALGTLPPVSIIIYGFGAIFFISASALILNDYFDIEIDRINAPERPLPSGRVSPAGVVFLFCIVSLTGLLLSYLISITALALAMLLWTVAFLYNRRFKLSGITGNLMVSFSVGMTFIFGGVSVGMPFETLVWFFGVLAFLINLGEEISADIMDMRGDRAIDSKSIPITYGAGKAMTVITVIFGTVIVISLAPFVFNLLPLLYLIPVVIMDAVIVYSVVRFRTSKYEEGRTYVRAIYLGALLGVLMILVMRIVM
jgi:geranylgeranylglycerol-phosphate geranylgeranyltransferase